MDVTQETWSVWGDSSDPVLKDVDYATMKAKVDGDTTDTLYGQNQTGEEYGA